MRHATFLSGSHDGLALGYEGSNLPRTITIDGELYSLSVRARGPAVYYAAPRRGRRRQFDSMAKQEFLAAFGSARLTVEQAARAVGFSSGPIYRALNLDPAFEHAYVAIRVDRATRPHEDGSVLLAVRVDREKFKLLEDQARRYGVEGGAAGVLGSPVGTTFREPVEKPWRRPSNLERKMLKGDGLPS